MASLDLNFDYLKAQDRIKATKAYTDLKSQYSELTSQAGQSYEKAKESVTTQIDALKNQAKSYQREVKNQFEQLLDINTTTGSKSVRYIKRQLIQATKNSYPKILEILFEESFKAVGCDQQQTYNANTPIYVRVASIDLGKLLKIDPNSDVGNAIYEKNGIQIQSNPFSMNRELYKRTQSNNPYSVDNAQLYFGASGQPLMDIQYDDLTPGGPWFVVTPQNRANSVNKVADFMTDYYKSIRVAGFEETMASVMNSLSGAISIKGDIGAVQADDATKFELILQRILGLCFDNKKEIDVSGISKLAELDGVDETFFEFTEIDLRNIDQKITNIKNGVVQFQNCDNVLLPVDADNILNGINNLKKVPDSDLVDAATKLTSSLTENPDWSGLAISGNIDAAVDLNFIKLLTQGLIGALLSPKVLLPIFVMLKSLGNQILDTIDSFVSFCKNFKSFIVNLVSKAGAIFVKELFEIIKRDIFNLIQVVIQDVARESKNKKLIIILKLIQILLVVAQFIDDWRRCKSVVDELLQLLTVLTTGWGGEIPLPLLFASQLLDGYSESRAFIGTIEELQKLGVPTGPMPDGSPNLSVLSMFSQMKAMAEEEASSGKVQTAIPPLAITPAGLTIPSSAFGKKF